MHKYFIEVRQRRYTTTTVVCECYTVVVYVCYTVVVYEYCTCMNGCTTPHHKKWLNDTIMIQS